MLTTYGARGVQLFFILSALTLASVSRHLNVSTFYIRRLFRIVPMFYLAAAFYIPYYGVAARYFAPNGIGLRHIIQTLTFTHGFAFDSINSVVPGGWSIAAEALFYAIFPALVVWLTTIQRTLIALSASVLLLIVTRAILEHLFADYQPRYLMLAFSEMWFPCALHAFIFGFLAFQVIDDAQKHAGLIRLRRPAAILAALVVLALAMCALSNWGVVTDYVVGDTLLFILVLAVATCGVGGGIISRALRHVGVVSFSIYLVHFALLDLFVPLLQNFPGIPPVLQLAGLFLTVLTVSTGVATVTHRYIERPFIDLGRRLTRSPSANTAMSSL